MQKVTTIFHRIHNLTKHLLTKYSSFDGRWLVGFSLIAYFALLWLANWKLMPYFKFWKKLGVPAVDLLFLDTNIVLSGFECTRKGYDVLLENPCHPGTGRDTGIIYPRIWWKLTGLGLDQSDAIILGILFALIFYGITLFLMGKLNIYEGIIYALIMCSPTVMFAIERGNPDIHIYILHFIALMMAQSHKLWLRIIGYVSLLIPIFLKILSFFSLAIILKEKKNTFIFWFLSLVMTSLIYVYSIKDEISVSQKGLPLRMQYSFYYKILLTKLTSVFNPEKIFSNKFNLILIFLLIIGLVILIGIIVKVSIGIFNDIKYNLLLEQSTIPNDNHVYNSLLLDSFRMGSSFYLGTFLVTTSWDYKLIFLLFTFPQIIAWIKENHQLSLSSTFALLGIISTFYLSSFQYRWLIDEVINWSIWFYFLYAFVLTLPKWIKILPNNLFSKGFLKKNISV